MTTASEVTLPHHRNPHYLPFPARPMRDALSNLPPNRRLKFRTALGAVAFSDRRNLNRGGNLFIILGSISWSKPLCPSTTPSSAPYAFGVDIPVRTFA
ncbi:hypothetical protein K443DRAFT_491839 [Laccaria amethystina LaAM-08-1]|uniref:Uncharacterized protein n=1 Tax=Laccaria amethystina LaAM-08-1 TaxID=1095629 RepID=A0A0C9XZF2_9AGAR|nr:hypothetical protein K443DRAFT_491839 [Laccaria amethystina LaAM-08-1]